jgi:nucleoid DNA-binding protein
MAYTKTNEFVKFLAIKYKLSEYKTRAIVMYAMKNMVTMIEQGEDIQIEGLGKIQFNKESYAAYLKSKQESKQSKKWQNKTTTTAS